MYLFWSFVEYVCANFNISHGFLIGNDEWAKLDIGGERKFNLVKSF